MSNGRALASLSATELQTLRRKAANTRLVFFDVDGTLVNSSRQVPQSARRAIHALRERGIKLAIASGRPPFAVEALSAELGLDAAGLFYTGAMLYQPANSQMLKAHALPLSVVQNIIAKARASRLHCELYTEQAYYSEAITEFSDYHSSYLGCAAQIMPFEPVLEQQAIYKVLLVAACDATKRRVKEIAAVFPELEFATGHGPDRPDIEFVSIVAPAACKRAGFEHLCAHHGVRAGQVMSFGDAQSDLVFLQMAGLGIAMGNAAASVQAASDYVAGHVDQDGLAAALQCLF